MADVLRRVARNTMVIFFGRIIALGLNTATMVLLARYWGESLFGIFSYGLVFVGFFSLLPDFGTQPILVRELARNRDGAGRMLGNVLVLKGMMSLAAVAFAAGFACVLFSDPVLRAAVIILSFTILVSSKVNSIRPVLDSVFQADMDMGYPVLFQIIDNALQTLVVLALVLLHAGSSVIFAGYVLSNIPGMVGMALLLRKRVHLRPKRDPEAFRWFLKESFPLFLYIALTLVYERLDVLFLKSAGGEQAVGLYSSAFRITAPLAFIPYAVTTALYPVMSRARAGEDSTRVRVLRMGLKGLLLVGIVLGSVGTLIGKPLFVGLFGARYAEAAIPFQLLLWGQCFSFLVFFLVDFNNSQNGQVINTCFMAVMLGLSVPVQAVLIGRFGILGAGWAKILLGTCALAVLFLLSRRRYTKAEQRSFFWVLGFAAFLWPALILCFLEPSAVWIRWVIFAPLALSAPFLLFSPEERASLLQVMRSLLKSPGVRMVKGEDIRQS